MLINSLNRFLMSTYCVSDVVYRDIHEQDKIPAFMEFTFCRETQSKLIDLLWGH